MKLEEKAQEAILAAALETFGALPPDATPQHFTGWRRRVFETIVLYSKQGWGPVAAWVIERLQAIMQANLTLEAYHTGRRDA